jgi:hypothetical protein
VKPKTPLSTSIPGDFPSFSKLPLELRLKIWKMTTEERRVVLIRTSEQSWKFTSSSPIPAALHVCSESREVALKTYKLSFGSRTDGFTARVFFNFNQDTLYFRGEWNGSPNEPQSYIGVFGTGVKEEERDRIQSLAVNMNTGASSPDAACRNINFQQWKGLRELRLCSEEQRLDLESNLQLREVKENDQWAVARDYRRMVNRRLVHQSLRPSDAVKKIEEAHLSFHTALKEILNANGGEGFSLAVVVGT